MILVFPDGRIGGSTLSDSEWANTPLRPVRELRAGRRARRRPALCDDPGSPGSRDRWLLRGRVRGDQHRPAPPRGIRVGGGVVGLLHRDPQRRVRARHGHRARVQQSDRSTSARLRRELAAFPLRVFMFVGRGDSASRQIVPMDKALVASGAHVRYAIYPGGHDWQLWYGHLNQMLILAGRDVLEPLPRTGPLVRHGASASAPARPRGPAPRPPASRPAAAGRGWCSHLDRSSLGWLRERDRLRRHARHGRADRRPAACALIRRGDQPRLPAPASRPERHPLARRQPLGAGAGDASQPLMDRWPGARLGWLRRADRGGDDRAAVARAVVCRRRPGAIRAVGRPSVRPPHLPARATRGAAGRRWAGGIADRPVERRRPPQRPGDSPYLLSPSLAVAIPIGLTRRAPLQAIAAGLLYGVADAAIKAVSVSWGTLGSSALLSGWTVLAVLCTFAGFLAFQAALRAGSAITGISLMNCLAALLALCFGLVAFGESLGRSPAASLAHLLAVALVLSCVPVLATAQTEIAETLEPSDLGAVPAIGPEGGARSAWQPSRERAAHREQQSLQPRTHARMPGPDHVALAADCASARTKPEKRTAARQCPAHPPTKLAPCAACGRASRQPRSQQLATPPPPDRAAGHRTPQAAAAATNHGCPDPRRTTRDRAERTASRARPATPPTGTRSSPRCGRRCRARATHGPPSAALPAPSSVLSAHVCPSGVH